MSAPLDDQLGFAPDYDSPVPYMQRTRDYYRRDRLHDALPLGALCRCAVPAAEKAVGQVARHHRHDSGPVWTLPRAIRVPGAAYNGSAKFYQVYDGDTREGARSADLAYRLRPQAHVSLPTAAPGFRCRSSSDSTPPRGGSARSRRASSVRRPIAATASPSMSMRPEILHRCRADKVDVACDRPQPPGLSADLQLWWRVISRLSGIPDRRDGLRQGHRRIRGRAALPVFGFPARQLRRQAA